jgi:histidine triad (HIT) family protein
VADAANPDCLFCGIVAGRIPSTKVREDELTFAFEDISPAAPTHVLVVPKRHITNGGTVEATDAEDLASLLLAAREVAKDRGIFETGYRLVFNVGDDALNSVPHLHLHVLGGRKLGWPPG